MLITSNHQLPVLFPVFSCEYSVNIQILQFYVPVPSALMDPMSYGIIFCLWVWFCGLYVCIWVYLLVLNNIWLKCFRVVLKWLDQFISNLF